MTVYSNGNSVYKNAFMNTRFKRCLRLLHICETRPIRRNTHKSSHIVLIIKQFQSLYIMMSRCSCLAGNTSVLLTMSFTVERYIAVCHPLRGRVLCTESRAKRVILMVALFCIACTASTPYEWHIAINPSTGKFQKSSTELGRNDIYKKAYNWFCIVTFICVPLLVLTVLNWFLINAVNQSRRNRTRLTCQVSALSVAIACLQLRATVIRGRSQAEHRETMRSPDSLMIF